MATQPDAVTAVDVGTASAKQRINEPIAGTARGVDQQQQTQPPHDGGAATTTTEQVEDVEAAKMVGFFELFQFADTSDKALIIIGSIAAFIGGAAMPSWSEIFGEMLDKLAANPADVATQVALVASIMVYVGIGVLFIAFVQVSCFMVSANRQTCRIRERYFTSMLRQEPAWHDANKPGELTARLTGDTKVIYNGISDKFSMAILNSSTFLFGFGYGFYRSWQLTLLLLGTMPILAAVGGFMAVTVTKLSEQSRAGFAKAGDIADEVLQNIRTVQTFGAEDREAERFEAELEPARAAGVKQQFGAMASVGVSNFVIFSSYGLAFWFSSYLVQWGANTVGQVIAVFFAVLIGSFAAGLVFPSIGEMAAARGAAFKVYEVINRVPQIDGPNDKRIIPTEPLRGKIEFRNVAFSYPTRLDAKLFTDLNVTIETGTTVAFSGPSGCGKSSIVQLIERYYDPPKGAVIIDDKYDLRDLDVTWWRSNVGIVSQEPNLFHGSIMDNVRVGKRDATLEEVQHACRRANIHDTIMTLPEQYDTDVGTVGSQLSGGQKQRIAIARAMIKSPQILILDEATSALDRKSEMEVQRALDEIVHGPASPDRKNTRRTVVVIAHRLTTIRNADVIHYISHDEVTGSKIEESGTFDDLVAQKGPFAQMVSKQTVSLRVVEQAHKEEEEEEGEDEASDVNKNNNKGGNQNAESNDGIATAAITAVPSGDGTGAAADGGTARNGSVHGSSLNNDSITSNNKGAIVVLTAEQQNQKALEERVKAEEEVADYSRARLGALAGSKSWSLVLGVIGSILSGCVYPAFSIVISRMLDVLGTHTPQQIRALTGMWAGLFVALGVTSCLGWTLQACYSIAGEFLTMKLRSLLFAKLLRKDQQFFDAPGRDSGSLGGMISGDCEAVHQLYGPTIGMRVQVSVNILGGVVIGFVYSWKIALVTLATVPIMVITGVVQQVMMLGLGSKAGETGVDTLAESLTNVRTVLAFNMQDAQSRAYGAASAAHRKSGDITSIIVAVAYGFTQFTYYGVFALAFWYGGTLMQKGELGFLDMLTASMAILMSAMGAGEAGGIGAKLQDADAAAKRVFAAIDSVPGIDVTKAGETAPFFIAGGGGGGTNGGAAAASTTTSPRSHQHEGGFRIDFHKVDFTYPARPKAKVLLKFSSHFDKNANIGLMGSTGCGKSTIIQLLSRFYQPTHGSIKIDGYPLESLDLKTWRQQLSIVLQEPNLFSGTVRYNIRYGRPEATDDEVEEVAKIACIHDDVLAMPSGYDTEVGFKGKMLSGGQKQRVAIARALLRRPRLLLLDEATSALDNATESRVMQGLREYLTKHRMSTVSVAHRLTTIKDSTSIVLLDCGVVLEQGTHEELVAKGGEYCARWEHYQRSAN